MKKEHVIAILSIAAISFLVGTMLYAWSYAWSHAWQVYVTGIDASALPDVSGVNVTNLPVDEQGNLRVTQMNGDQPEPRSMTSILLENRTVESIEDRFHIFCNVSEFSEIKLAWNTTSEATNNAFVFRYRWVVFPEDRLGLGEVLYVPPGMTPPKYYTMTLKTDIYPIAGFGNTELEVNGPVFFLWVYEHSTAFEENTIEYITLFATS